MRPNDLFTRCRRLALGAALVLGVSCGGSTVSEWERCGAVPEADPGDDESDAARLFCIPPPETEGNGCPAAELMVVNDVVEPVLGDREDTCAWEGYISCGPAQNHKKSCCYVVEYVVRECNSSADDR